MIISEPYNMASEQPLWKIYSDNGFFIRYNTLVLREAIVSSIEELNNYVETNVPIPSALANDFFVRFNLMGEKPLTEDQVIEAKPILKKALNLLSDEDAYLIRYLYSDWIPNQLYKPHERVLYNNELYNVIQQCENIIPENGEYYHTVERPANYIDEWQKNHEYQIGDKVKYGVHIYKNLFDKNTWSPQEFSAAWELIS